MDSLKTRQQSEQELRESEERLRLALMAANQGLYDLNVQTGEAQVSPEYARMLGFDPLDFHETNAKWIARLHPEDRARTEAAYQAYTRGKITTYQVEFRQQTRDGDWRWILSLGKIVEWTADGKPLRMLGTHTDITERKRAEEELRRQRDTAQQYLDIAAVILVALNTHGEVTLINRRGCEILGYREEELIGTNWFARFVPERLRSAVVDVFARIMADEPSVTEFYENPILTRSGQERLIAWHNTRLKEPDGRIVGTLSSGEDITERRRAVEALTESNRVLSTLMSNLPGMAYRCRNDAQWTMEFVSEGCYPLTGYEPGDLLGNHRVSYADLIPAEHRGPVWGEVQAALAARRFFELNYAIRTADGREKWVWERGRGVLGSDGQLMFLEGFVTDVTQRKRAEDALQAILAGTASQTGEEFFRSLVRHLAHALRVRYALVSETRNLAQARTLAVWAGHDFAENFEYALDGTPCDNAMRQGPCVHPRNVQQLFPRDRLLRDLAVESYLGTPLRDASGTVRGLLSVMDDRPMEETALPSHILTVFAARAGAELGRKHAEEQRQRLEARLYHAQKMEAIGQLAGGVAHDFNNILTATLGNVELALAELDQPALPATTVVDCLRQIERSAQRAAALTRQLLAFSRRQISQPRVLDVNRVLGEMGPMLRRLLTENITLDLLLEPNAGAVLADAGQIEQVVMNLVVNARDAMPNGGRLTIATQETVVDETYAEVCADLQPGRYVRVSVNDTGCGMDAATRARIFEPFFTTKPVGQGTGLGLATVYGLVQQSGGHVLVYSEPGRGSAFHVLLPVALTTPPQPESPSTNTTLPTGTETVLVCEDDAAVRELTSQLLTGAGYAVLTASDGQAAQRLAAQCDPPIDLLLTDVVMPGMDGKQLAESLAVDRPTLRVLFASGYSASVIGHHGVLDRGVAFLQKPFSRSQLLQRVREVLDAPPGWSPDPLPPPSARHGSNAQ